MAASKQDQLAALIAEKVSAEVSQTFQSITDDLGSQLAAISVQIAATGARLEALETVSASAPAKRPARSEAKGGAGKAAAGGPPAAKKEFKNAKLYTQGMWVADREFRERFRTDEFLQALGEAKPEIASQPEGEKRFKAEGGFYWDSRGGGGKDLLRGMMTTHNNSLTAQQETLQPDEGPADEGEDEAGP